MVRMVLHFHNMKLPNKKTNCTTFPLVSQATTEKSPITYAHGIMTLRMFPIQDGHLPDEV